MKLPGFTTRQIPGEMNIVPVFSPASPRAQTIVGLFNIVLGVCAVIFVIVCSIVAWSLIRFRGGPESPEPRQTVGIIPLEAALFISITWAFYFGE